MISELTLNEKKDLLKELEKAFCEGVSEVEFKDRKIKYRSLNEMKQIMSHLRSSLGTTSKGKRIIAKFVRP